MFYSFENLKSEYFKAISPLKNTEKNKNLAMTKKQKQLNIFKCYMSNSNGDNSNL